MRLSLYEFTIRVELLGGPKDLRRPSRYVDTPMAGKRLFEVFVVLVEFCELCSDLSQNHVLYVVTLPKLLTDLVACHAATGVFPSSAKRCPAQKTSPSTVGARPSL